MEPGWKFDPEVTRKLNVLDQICFDLYTDFGIRLSFGVPGKYVSISDEYLKKQHVFYAS